MGKRLEWYQISRPDWKDGEWQDIALYEEQADKYKVMGYQVRRSQRVDDPYEAIIETGKKRNYEQKAEKSND